MVNLWHVCYKCHEQPLHVACSRLKRQVAQQQIGQEAESRVVDHAGNQQRAKCRAADCIGSTKQEAESRVADWTEEEDWSGTQGECGASL